MYWRWNMTATSEQTVVVRREVPVMERKLFEQRRRLHSQLMAYDEQLAIGREIVLNN